MQEDNNYSKREIDGFHVGIHEALGRIEKQVTLTNGRITRMEKWKERVVGASGVIVLVLLPIMTWALLQITSINERVSEALSKELSKYEVTIES